MTNARGETRFLPHPGQYPPYPQPLYYAPVYAPPTHPSATIALVLGIAGIATLPVLCGLGLVMSPVAWVLGSKAVREIDAAPQHYSGRSQAKAGVVLGIIGTVLLVLAMIALVLVVGLIVTGETEGPVLYENT